MPTTVLPGQSIVKATPKLVREYPVAEVFFVDHPKSYVIPDGPARGRIYNKLMQAAQTRAQVVFLADSEKRMILSLEGDAVGFRAASEGPEESPSASVPATTASSDKKSPVSKAKSGGPLQ